MDRGHRSRPDLLLWGLVLLTVLVGGVLAAYTRAMHFRFAFSAYDVGIHLQALWKFSRLQGLFNTVRGLNYWGDHLWISFALLAPLYRMWTSPTLLYLYQGFGLAVGGLAVYGLARARLKSRAAPVVSAFLYWCYPGLIYMAQENFHPEAVGSTWLLLMLWAREVHRPCLYWTSVVLALLTKEDIPLYLFGYAAYEFVRGERRRALILSLVSGGYFVIAVKVLLPYFNGVGFFRFGGGYWFSHWAANAMNPAFYAARLMRSEFRAYLWDLLWPVAFLPLGHPLKLMMLSGPALLVNTLGGGYMLSIHYHYLYGIIPGIFATTVASLESLERLAARWPSKGWIRRLGAAMAIGVILLPSFGLQILRWRTSGSYVGMVRRLGLFQSWTNKKHNLLEELIAGVPADAKVSASHNLVPFLANRQWIFMFPNPWKVTYWGIDGENLPSPDLVDTLFIDTRAIGPEHLQLMRGIIANGWDIKKDEMGVVLARRVDTTRQAWTD